ILLLDGLDEVGSPEARKRLRDDVVMPLLAEAENSLAVLTSRVVGYDEVEFDWDPQRLFERGQKIPPGALRRCYVAPFNDAEIKEFVSRLYAARERDSRVL